MRGEPPNQHEASGRIAEASDWFARMRGPDAGAARRAFAQWYADPENARAYAEIEQVWASVGQGSAGTSGRSAAPQGRWHWVQYGLAAAVATVALAAALILTGFGWPAGPDEGKPVIYASKIGEIREVTLVDGTIVKLDTATRLAVDFSSGDRLVRLHEGRARFNVAHDESRPFMVLAQGHAVIARGTIFDVRRENDGLEVTLLEGAVDIKEAGASANAPIRLLAGHRVLVSDGSDNTVVAPVAEAETLWTKGTLEMDGVPLAQVVRELNRYSASKIRLADPASGALEVTGVLRLDDPDAAVAKLSAALGLTLSRQPRGDLVLAASAR